MFFGALSESLMAAIFICFHLLDRKLVLVGKYQKISEPSGPNLSFLPTFGLLDSADIQRLTEKRGRRQNNSSVMAWNEKWSYF